MNEKQLVIFDYDGVIVDSIDAVTAIAARACREIGHSRFPHRADIQALENIAFEDLGRKIGISEADLPRFGDHVFALLQKNGKTPDIFPGMDRVIRTLAGNHYLAIVTKNIKPAVEKVLAAHGLAGKISLILGIEEPGSKADKIKKAMQIFNRGPDLTCMIGDAVSDIRQARQAGVRSIAVTWGYHTREKLAHEGPDIMVSEPHDITAVISPDSFGMDTDSATHMKEHF
ncbi:MAG: hypothetical protein DRH32_02230 [Deltaproteobacteria bacterium]|nr:MAG: hypothetical protein DRH32_02230 [Deltaproteobacteria bacterium]